MWPAWVLSFACLAGLAYETTKLARGLVSEAVAVYPVIGDPPLSGASHVTSTAFTCELSTAVTPVGAAGVVAGTTGADAGLTGLLPASLVATTVKVYG